MNTLRCNLLKLKNVVIILDNYLAFEPIVDFCHPITFYNNFQDVTIKYKIIQHRKLKINSHWT